MRSENAERNLEAVVLLLLVGAMAYAYRVSETPTPVTDLPPLVAEYHGTRLYPTEALRAEWADVMTCVGLSPQFDNVVTWWQLPEQAALAGMWHRQPIDLFGNGGYDGAHHAVVLPGGLTPAQRQRVLRHEMVHARLQTSRHPLPFTTWKRCNLGRAPELPPDGTEGLLDTINYIRR